jgi:hypothetical protein
MESYVHPSFWFSLDVQLSLHAVRILSYMSTSKPRAQSSNGAIVIHSLRSFGLSLFAQWFSLIFRYALGGPCHLKRDEHTLLLHAQSHIVVGQLSSHNRNRACAMIQNSILSLTGFHARIVWGEWRG